MAETPIQHISDTALWVATFRALENERPDALFKDPYAGRLAGERGPEIASRMRRRRYTSWVVVTRTVIIDDFIKQLVADGVDAVVNLGAGLDARPYRMNLPKTLRWYEVDYEPMLAMKVEKLANDIPTCTLERLPVDLTNPEKRKSLFAHVTKDASKVAVLTEGVIPYLTPAQVTDLAGTLRSYPEVRYWIADYMSERIQKRFRSINRGMGNAPFRFMPGDWNAFFANAGWQPQDIRYYIEESRRLGRPTPMPLRAVVALAPKKHRAELTRMAGYAVLTPKN